MPWCIAAVDERLRLYEQSKADLAPFLGGAIEAPVILKEAPVHKCESCGSRQFAKLNGVRICAYCRSEQ